MHGDPSPRNTLVESGDRIRLIDYNSACRLSQGYGTIGTVSFKGVTPGYGDDEILINGKRPDRGTDMYAAAAIAVRVLTDQDLPAGMLPPPRSGKWTAFWLQREFLLACGRSLPKPDANGMNVRKLIRRCTRRLARRQMPFKNGVVTEIRVSSGESS